MTIILHILSKNRPLGKSGVLSHGGVIRHTKFSKKRKAGAGAYGIVTRYIFML